MAYTQGDARSGWRVFFTIEDTENIADAVAAGAVAAALVPEPVVSKIISVSGGIIALGARRAARYGYGLGVQVESYMLPSSISFKTGFQYYVRIMKRLTNVLPMDSIFLHKDGEVVYDIPLSFAGAVWQSYPIAE